MEVLSNKKSLLTTSLLNKYKAEYASNGGNLKDIFSYTSQNLLRKVQDKLADKVRIYLLISEGATTSLVQHSLRRRHGHKYVMIQRNMRKMNN